MDPDIHQSYSKFFNEQYNISQKLINRLVEKTMESSFPHSQQPVSQVRLPPANVCEMNISKFHGITLTPEKYDRNIIDLLPSQHDLREDSLQSIRSISIPLDYLDPLSPARDFLRPPVLLESSDEEEIDVPDPSVVFIGSENLPEYSSLSQTASACDGTIDMSHLNFGNHRIAILSEKLAQCGKDHEVVSLCLSDNRLTDGGIVEVIRNLALSPHRNMTNLDLSSNKMGRTGSIALAMYLNALPNIQRLNISNMSLGDMNIRIFFNILTAVGLGSVVLDTVEDFETVDDATLIEAIAKYEGVDEIHGQRSTATNCAPSTIGTGHTGDGSGGGSTSVDAFERMGSLRSLRVMNNKIEESGARAIARFLQHGGSGLAELDMSWNEIRGEGAICIWKSLQDHTGLTALDMSWNSIGVRKGGDAAAPTNDASKFLKGKAVAGGKRGTGERTFESTVDGNTLRSKNSPADVLRSLLDTNCTLLHLSISHNKFTASDMDMVSKGLRHNHTLLGLHITGNPGRMDNYGFLKGDNEPWPLGASHMSEQIIMDFSTKQVAAKRKTFGQSAQGDSRNCCWVCSGWQEVEFDYQLNAKDMKKFKKILLAGEKAVPAHKLAREKEKISRAFPVHLITSFDNWMPERMVLREPKDRRAVDDPGLHLTLMKPKQPHAVSRADSSANATATSPPTAQSDSMGKSSSTRSAPGGSIARRGSIANRRRLSLAKNTAQQQHSPQSSAIPHPPLKSKPSANVVRRRVSFSAQELDCFVSGQKKAEHAAPSNTDETHPSELDSASAGHGHTVELIKRSESYAFDSSSEDEFKNEEELPARAAAFENARYMLQSFESGHWSMTGGLSNRFDSDEEGEDEFAASLYSHPTAGMKMATMAGRGQLLNVQNARLEKRVHAAHAIDAPVYSLRRMVPPGRHTYLFAVGYPTDHGDGSSSDHSNSDDENNDTDTEGSSRVHYLFKHDANQPHGPTKVAMNVETKEMAARQGIVLPPVVNTLVIANSKRLAGMTGFRANSRKQNIPEALVLAERLSHSRSAQPRRKNEPSINHLHKKWRKKDSILFRNSQFREERHIKDMFNRDWQYCKTRQVFLKDDVECDKIREAAYAKYRIILNMFTTYSSLFSGDPCGMSGSGYNEMILGCFVLEPLVDFGENSDSVQGSISEPNTSEWFRTAAPVPAPAVTAAAGFDKDSGIGDVDDGNRDHIPLSQLPTLTVPRIPQEAKLVAPKSRGSKVVTSSNRARSFLRQISLQEEPTPFKPTAAAGSAGDSFAGDDDVDDYYYDDDDDNDSVEAIMSGEKCDNHISPAIPGQTIPATANVVGGQDGGLVVDGQIKQVHEDGTHRESQLALVVNGDSQSTKLEGESAQSKAVVPKRRKGSTLGGRVVGVTANRKDLLRITDGAVSRAEVDMIFVTNCVTGPKVRLNSNRVLSRFQYLDALISLACLKYIQAGVCQDVASALERMVDELLGQYALVERDEVFIAKFLTSKAVDHYLRANWKTVEKIFKSGATGSDLSPIESRLLPWDIWTTMLRGIKLKIGDRPAKSAFSHSKTLHMVDVFGDNYDVKHLYFIEFVEALVRLAWHKRKTTLEEEPDDTGKGLSPHTVVEQLEVIIAALTEYILRKNDKSVY